MRFDFLNVQDQPRFVWPASFVVARAYVDQLERSKGLTGARLSSLRKELSRIEKLAGAARQTALLQLVTQLETEAQASTDKATVQTLIGALKELAS